MHLQLAAIVGWKLGIAPGGNIKLHHRSMAILKLRLVLQRPKLCRSVQSKNPNPGFSNSFRVLMMLEYLGWQESS